MPIALATPIATDIPNSDPPTFACSLVRFAINVPTIARQTASTIVPVIAPAQRTTAARLDAKPSWRTVGTTAIGLGATYPRCRGGGASCESESNVGAVVSRGQR